MARATKKPQKQKSETRGLPPITDDWWYAPVERAGAVSSTTAERVAAVYACKRVICESVAMLPVSIFEETDDGVRKKNADHPLYSLLRHSPNPIMDSFTFFNMMQASILDTGNAYAHILRTKSGAIARLTPLIADRMTVSTSAIGEVSYTYRDGSTAKVYSPADIFHLKHDTKDGILGRSPIKVAAETVGFAYSLLEHGNQLFKNGAFLSGFVKAPMMFKDDEKRAAFMDSFKKYFGSGNAGKAGLLEGGVDWAPFAMNNRDAQFLEAKNFSVLEIARIFRVPPHMIQDLSQGASYASIEQQSINFVTYTVQPWVTLWERAIKFQLLRDRPDEAMFARFNISALIRSDQKTRVDAVKEQISYGLMTINEGRTMLDYNPLEDKAAQEPLVSHNLIPLSRVLERTPTSLQAPKPADKVESARFVPLVTEALRRLVAREEKTVAKERARQENFGEWVDRWLPEHLALVRESLAPVFLAVRGEEMPAEVADQWIVDLRDAIAAEAIADRIENWLRILIEGARK